MSSFTRVVYFNLFFSSVEDLNNLKQSIRKKCKLLISTDSFDQCDVANLIGLAEQVVNLLKILKSLEQEKELYKDISFSIILERSEFDILSDINLSDLGIRVTKQGENF
jgi:hypothetical protein